MEPTESENKADGAPSGLNGGLGSTLRLHDFPNGMTVAELKKLVRDWPETDEYGDPCEVWLCDARGLSNQAKRAGALNRRQNDDGSKLWADFILEHDA